MNPQASQNTMGSTPQTYRVGRANSTVPCDIAIPAREKSVSRRHLELTPAPDGRCFLVHVHPRNRTHVFRDGKWREISQDYVDPDTPLRLGAYHTTARRLLAMLAADPPPHPAPGQEEAAPDAPEFQWDPEAGTIVRRRNI